MQNNGHVVNEVIIPAIVDIKIDLIFDGFF